MIANINSINNKAAHVNKHKCINNKAADLLFILFMYLHMIKQT